MYSEKFYQSRHASSSTLRSCDMRHDPEGKRDFRLCPFTRLSSLSGCLGLQPNCCPFAASCRPPDSWCFRRFLAAMLGNISELRMVIAHITARYSGINLQHKPTEVGQSSLWNWTITVQTIGARMGLVEMGCGKRAQSGAVGKTRGGKVKENMLYFSHLLLNTSESYDSCCEWELTGWWTLVQRGSRVFSDGHPP